MTTATIVFDDQQQAEIEKQLEVRNASKRAAGEPELTLDEFSTLELVYALGLTKTLLTSKEAAAIAEKYAQLSDKDRAEIKAAIDAKVVGAEVVVEPIQP